ncbi:MAG: hypothetical protein MMC23_009355 [Stictis urceolatum]|nr:hypothetical protein [Stictis urceolata]
MALRIAPTSAHPSSTSNLTNRNLASDQVEASFSAPSAPGLHDTLRASLTPAAATSAASCSSPHTFQPTPTSTHPLETRLLHWRATQHALKMEGLKRTYGIAEPIRRGMELGITRHGEWRPGTLGRSAGVSGDILEGRDTEVAWEDVYNGGLPLLVPFVVYRSLMV